MNRTRAFSREREADTFSGAPALNHTMRARAHTHAIRTFQWIPFSCSGACVFALESSVGSGVTWTGLTMTAPWAARFEHTSVIDAAGAIYVIGGESGGTFFQDVWASTDGGARPDSRRGVVGGYWVGTHGGTK